MTDVLGALVARSLGEAEVLRPRLAARFEPDDGAVGLGVDEAAGAGERDDRETARARPDAASPAPAPARAVSRGGERALSRPVHQAGIDGEPAHRAARPTAPAPPPDVPAEATFAPLPSPGAGAADDTAAPAGSPHDRPAVEPPAPVHDAPRERTDARGPDRPGPSAPAPDPRDVPAPSAAEPLAAPGESAAPPRIPAIAAAARSAAPLPTPESDAAAEPVVHVHIGRIEVRAAAPPERLAAPRPREPLLSLDAYLDRAAEGGR